MTEQLSDEELLRQHLDGDKDAFGTLFTRHRDRLWAVALRTCGNPEEAADALQDALISAYRRAENFRGDAQVTTWLHRIVVNASLDRLRRAQVRAADPLPDDLDRRMPDRTPSGDPEAAAIRLDQRRILLDALDQISPDQKAALVLVDMEGYSVHEAAQILDTAAGTVKSRCSRGRARLAELLGPLLAAQGTRAAAETSEWGDRAGPQPPGGDETAERAARQAAKQATKQATKQGGDQG